MSSNQVYWCVTIIPVEVQLNKNRKIECLKNLSSFAFTTSPIAVGERLKE